LLVPGVEGESSVHQRIQSMARSRKEEVAAFIKAKA